MIVESVLEWENQVIQLSIDESIKRLKGEIIAQDWGLSEKRIELLEAAFFCLKKRFKNRKAAHSILIMAGSVLDYVRKRGENSPSDSIDFLKEAMAHVVNLYEADEFDPEKDEKLFKGLYARFNILKGKIKEERQRLEEPSQAPPAEHVSTPAIEASEEAEEEEVLHPDKMEQLRGRVQRLREQDLALDRGEVDRLVQDLQTSLERAEYLGETIRRLLDELMKVRELGRAGVPADPFPEEREEAGRGFVLADEMAEFDAPHEQSAVKNCPATELRGLCMAGNTVFVQENAISLIREVSRDRLAGYLKNSRVPLAHFGGLFRSLSRQFSGSLSHIADKKLKKLSLPVMIPTGRDLSDLPDEEGVHLVFVTNGQWNGVLLCSRVEKETVAMVKFRKARNGDFAGVGYSEDGAELPLLNAVSVLRREGFLTMV